MASTINASSAYGLVSTADTSGTLALQANGTTISSGSTAGMSVLGTTTNDNAPAGFVGEYITSKVTASPPTGLTSGVSANATSIVLTAGDWDVTGGIALNCGGGTTPTFAGAGFSSTSATYDQTLNGQSLYFAYTGTTSGGLGIALPPVRFSLATTTTIYLVGQYVFTGGTAGIGGYIRARRVR